MCAFIFYVWVLKTKKGLYITVNPQDKTCSWAHKTRQDKILIFLQLCIFISFDDPTSANWYLSISWISSDNRTFIIPQLLLKAWVVIVMQLNSSLDIQPSVVIVMPSASFSVWITCTSYVYVLSFALWPSNVPTGNPKFCQTWFRLVGVSSIPTSSPQQEILWYLISYDKILFHLNKLIITNLNVCYPFLFFLERNTSATGRY